MKIYIAHTRYENGCAVSQTVLEHLEETAKLAKGFASKFGAEADGEFVGMLHDIGKYSDEFQEHIEHPELPRHVDHSTAGAKAIGYPTPASFVIAGHHAGIPDGGSKTDNREMSTLHGRLKRENLPNCEAWKNEVLLPRNGVPAFVDHGDLFTQQFYTRMLFSCLVDADYLDTERFMQGEKPRGSKAAIASLCAKLDEHTGRFFPPKNDLNRIRCKILRECQEAGIKKPGLYSLTVPTGGGKTLSSLSFALHHAVENGMDRVIYVVPYTSIIDQTAYVFGKILGKGNILEHHSGIVYDEKNDLDYRRMLAAENYDMPIIITTAVQFFESLYANRTSKCRKLHNIANSVIIFDEAQALPLPYLMPCVRAIAELVKNYRATAVLCTATQPALDKYFADYGLSISELYPEREEAFAQLRRVTYRRIESSYEEISEQLSAQPQVLCVVNRRKTAQELYAGLPKEGSYCLTTLLYPAHRKALFTEIRERLESGKECRVISTSLIEAGVDLDFPCAFREEAGLDSVLQTAGRCNREGMAASEDSVVTVFQTEEKVPRMIEQNAKSAERIWKKYPQPDMPEAIERYFRFYRTLKGTDALDRKGILLAIERGIVGCLYPFKQIAEQFQLIESPTSTVYIPDGEGAELIEKLRRGELSRNLFRKLGQYGVSVYPDHFSALKKSGALEVLPSGDAILTRLDYYQETTGLTMDVDSGQAWII